MKGDGCRKITENGQSLATLTNPTTVGPLNKVILKNKTPSSKLLMQKSGYLKVCGLGSSRSKNHTV
jgi:hypothetical protein